MNVIRLTWLLAWRPRAGYSTRVVLPASFVRVAVTTLVCELVLFPIIWHAVLNGEERVYLKERISSKFSKLWMRVTNK